MFKKFLLSIIQKPKEGNDGVFNADTGKKKGLQKLGSSLVGEGSITAPYIGTGDWDNTLRVILTSEERLTVLLRGEVIYFQCQSNKVRVALIDTNEFQEPEASHFTENEYVFVKDVFVKRGEQANRIPYKLVLGFSHIVNAHFEPDDISNLRTRFIPGIIQKLLSEPIYSSPPVEISQIELSGLGTRDNPIRNEMLAINKFMELVFHSYDIDQMMEQSLGGVYLGIGSSIYFLLKDRMNREIPSLQPLAYKEAPGYQQRYVLYYQPGTDIQDMKEFVSEDEDFVLMIEQ